MEHTNELIDYCETHLAFNCVFYLFNYGTETIFISLVGAVIPLVISTSLLIAFGKRSNALRVMLYSISVLVIVLVADSVARILYNTIAISTGWYFIIFYLISFAYIRTGISKEAISYVATELYAIASYGVFLSDPVRTITGILNIPVIGLYSRFGVWGGGFFFDAVFLAGLLMMTAFPWALLLRVLVAKLAELRGSEIVE